MLSARPPDQGEVLLVGEVQKDSRGLGSGWNGGAIQEHGSSSLCLLDLLSCLWSASSPDLFPGGVVSVALSSMAEKRRQPRHWLHTPAGHIFPGLLDFPGTHVPVGMTSKSHQHRLLMKRVFTPVTQSAPTIT